MIAITQGDRNTVYTAIAAALVAAVWIAVVYFGVQAFQDSRPTNPTGMQARTAAVEQMNEAIARGGR